MRDLHVVLNGCVGDGLSWEEAGHEVADIAHGHIRRLREELEEAQAEVQRLEQERKALLTTKQASELLSLSPRTLEKWRVRGEGPPFVKLGNAVRYRLCDMLRYLDEAVRQ